MATVPQIQTVSALDAFDEDEHVELIDGRLVHEAMTSFEHGDAQSSIAVELKSRFRGHGPPGGEGWWIATEVDVVYSDAQCFRHDVAGWRKSRVPERPVGRRVTVRPDWVCEVLSTNRNKDLVGKRRALHRHGVPHYWTIDPDEPLLTVLRHHPDGYLIVTSVFPRDGADGARLEPFESVELEVSRLFGDIE
jgi:Uma2 family endonuclease